MREKEESAPELFKAQYDSMDWVVKKTGALYKDLEAMDKLLDEMPDILASVHADVTAPRPGKEALKSRFGRPGEITTEQAFRCAILKMLRGYSYRDLAEQIDLTPIYRKFTRFHGNEIPDFTTIERVVKLISGESLQKANEALARLGIKKNVEGGKAIRHDTMVVETDIIHPLDSRMLSVSVHAATRLSLRLIALVGGGELAFPNRTRRAKKRAYQIVMEKGRNAKERRAGLYRDLLKVQKQVLDKAQALLAAVRARAQLATARRAQACARELERVIALGRQVHDQTHRRIVKGEAVPACEKLFSFFETHTDLICRGKSGSPAEFGHKIDFAIGKSGLVTRYEVLKGNPCDGEVLQRALEDHAKLFGQPPEKLAADRRYHSAANEAMAAARGVSQVAIPKPGKLSRDRSKEQRKPWFRKLTRFRAGVEGCLSTLLRRFGLKRCAWKGKESFDAYVGFGVLAYNLRLIARQAQKT